MELQQHKNLRLKGYDYSTAGYYFITPVTENRRELFGNSDNGKIRLTETGMMIKNCIDGISTRFADVKVINNVVMPNHIHAVLYSNGSDNLSEVVRQSKAVTSRLYNKALRKTACKSLARGYGNAHFTML